MDVIKQQNEWDCLVATGQMITGCSYEEVAEAIWDGQAYSVSKMIQFCVSKGYWVGVHAFDVSVSGEIPGMIEVDMDDVLQHPAYVSVVSNIDPTYSHAVYWDGEQVCDPAVGERRPLKDYHVNYWYPIRRLEDLFDTSPIEDEELVAKIAKTNGPSVDFGA